MRKNPAPPPTPQPATTSDLTAACAAATACIVTTARLCKRWRDAHTRICSAFFREEMKGDGSRGPTTDEQWAASKLKYEKRLADVITGLKKLLAGFDAAVTPAVHEAIRTANADQPAIDAWGKAFAWEHEVARESAARCLAKIRRIHPAGEPLDLDKPARNPTNNPLLHRSWLMAWPDELKYLKDDLSVSWHPDGRVWRQQRVVNLDKAFARAAAIARSATPPRSEIGLAQPAAASEPDMGSPQTFSRSYLRRALGGMTRTTLATYLQGRGSERWRWIPVGREKITVDLDTMSDAHANLVETYLRDTPPSKRVPKK